MTFNPEQIPPYVLPDERSDFEEALVPSRTQVLTEPIVAQHNPQTSQGTPTLTSAPVITGHADIQCYKWL